jgi:hypothetical protein
MKDSLGYDREGAALPRRHPSAKVRLRRSEIDAPSTRRGNEKAAAGLLDTYLDAAIGAQGD